eukprot:752641-Hanusia_phi.AAC.2
MGWKAISSLLLALCAGLNDCEMCRVFDPTSKVSCSSTVTIHSLVWKTPNKKTGDKLCSTTKKFSFSDVLLTTHTLSRHRISLMSMRGDQSNYNDLKLLTDAKDSQMQDERAAKARRIALLKKAGVSTKGGNQKGKGDGSDGEGGEENAEVGCAADDDDDDDDDDCS